jgi:hypothetical protein
VAERPSGDEAPPAPRARYPEAGLCDTCTHAELKRTQRSRFLRCGLSDTDASFERYPRLPVLACRGHRPFEPA